MAVDPTSFKQCMAQFASGVTIVTTTHDGEPYGMTVAAFSSVSLEPPLVLVCIAKTATSCEPIGNAGVFAVHILAAEQAHLGLRFSSKNTMKERFDGLPHGRVASGAPVLEGCLGYVDCRVASAHDAGDHVIYVGEPLAAASREGGEVLVHFRRAFHGLTPLPAV